MRKFRLVQIRQRPIIQSGAPITPETPYKDHGSRILWHGEMADAPTIDTIRTVKGSFDEPRCGCCEQQLHIRYAYLVQEFVAGEWVPELRHP